MVGSNFELNGISWLPLGYFHPTPGKWEDLTEKYKTAALGHKSTKHSELLMQGGFFDWSRPEKFQVWNWSHPIVKKWQSVHVVTDSTLYCI